MFELPKKFDREYSGIFRTIGRDVFSAGILKKEDTTVDWLGGSFPLFSVSVILRGRGSFFGHTRDIKAHRCPIRSSKPTWFPTVICKWTMIPCIPIFPP